MINIESAKALISRAQWFYGQDVFRNVGSALADRKLKIKIAFKAIRVGKKYTLFNFLLLNAVILFYDVFRYPAKNKDVFQYGVTKNDLRAFDSFNKCLDADLRATVSVERRRPSLKEKSMVILAFRDLWCAANMLAKKSHDDPLVQVRSVVAGAAFVFYSNQPLPSNLSVVCIACDHSPVAMALLLLSRAAGQKTCYVQHAPVTEYFPPLATDLAVLFDDKSVDSYNRAAKRNGVRTETSVVLMPPFKELFQRPFVEHPPYNIGICLDRLPDLENLKHLLGTLADSSNARSIFLRPHPACGLDLSCLLVDEKVAIQQREGTLADFVEYIDLALISNSGTSIELLHEGIPTFYTPGTDDLPYDYYCFVTDGILPVLDLEKIFEPEYINTQFNKGWEERFSWYDVTVYHSIEDCSANVAEAFKNLLGAT